MSDDNRLNEVHNQGEKDASNGEYHRPYNSLDIIVSPNWRTEEMIKENEAYDKGWNNTDKQS